MLLAWSDASLNGRGSGMAALVLDSTWQVLGHAAGRGPAWATQSTSAECAAAATALRLAARVQGATRVVLHMDSTGALGWLADARATLGLDAGAWRRHGRRQPDCVADMRGALRAVLAAGLDVELVHVKGHVSLFVATREQRANALVDSMARAVARGLHDAGLVFRANAHLLGEGQCNVPMARLPRASAASPRPSLRAVGPHDRCVVCGLPSADSLYCAACEGW